LRAGDGYRIDFVEMIEDVFDSVWSDNNLSPSLANKNNIT